MAVLVDERRVLRADYVYTLEEASLVVNRSVVFLRKVIGKGRLKVSLDSRGYLVTGTSLMEYLERCVYVPKKKKDEKNDGENDLSNKLQKKSEK